jgi:hypothetical protein
MRLHIAVGAPVLAALAPITAALIVAQLFAVAWR